MNACYRFFSWIEKLAWLLGIIGVSALILMVLAISADVVCRYFFNSPIDGVRDLQQLFNAFIVSAMMPILIRCDGNITINFIDYVKKPKFLKVIRIIAHLAAFVLLCLLTYRLWGHAAYMAANNELTIILLRPIAPWWYIASACMGYSALMCLYNIFHAVFPKEEREAASGGAA